MKKQVGDKVEVLYDMYDLKASMTNIQIAQTLHDIVKMYAAAVGMVINAKRAHSTECRDASPTVSP